MIAIFVGAFLTALSTSTINVAVPVLMEHFHSDLSSIQWTLTGFLLATGTIAPLTGYLGERYSYKRLYLVCLCGFTLFSLLCALSWNTTSLVAFRTMQGVFSGLVMPTTMTMIFQIVPRNRQASALSLWSLSTMLGPAIGPTLAGVMIEHLSWHWLFLMNVPVGLVAIVLTVRLIPYFRLNVPKGFDLFGLITCIVGSLSLLIALSNGHEWGFASFKTIGLIAFGLLVLASFFWWEVRSRAPLLDVRVFLNKRFSLSLIVTSIVTMSLYSGAYLTPLFLQTILGETPLVTGLVLLPASLVMALLMPFVGRLYPKTGPMPLMIAGVLLVSFGTWMMSGLTLATTASYVMLWMIVRNVGISLSHMPSSNAGMEEIPREQSGYASSISNWVRNVMGAFSIALFTTIISSRTAVYREQLIEQQVDSKTIPHLSLLQAMNDVFLLAALIALIGLPICLMIRKRKTSLSEA